MYCTVLSFGKGQRSLIGFKSLTFGDVIEAFRIFLIVLIGGADPIGKMYAREELVHLLGDRIQNHHTGGIFGMATTGKEGLEIE